MDKYSTEHTRFQSIINLNLLNRRRDKKKIGSQKKTNGNETIINVLVNGLPNTTLVNNRKKNVLLNASDSSKLNPFVKIFF